MSWEYDATVKVIKAVRIGTGSDAKVYTTADAAAFKCAYLRNALFVKGKTIFPLLTLTVCDKKDCTRNYYLCLNGF